MLNPFNEINWHPEEREIADFGKTVLIGFSVIAVIFFLLGCHKAGHLNFFKISIITLGEMLVFPVILILCGYFVFLLSAVFPVLAKPLYLVWFFVSALIGVVVSNFALLVFYYLLFSPFAVIFRILSGRDPLRIKRRASKTCWQDYGARKELKRYFRQF